MELMTALINNESASDEKEALEIMTEMRNRIWDGEDPEEVLHEYVFDLI